MKYDSINKMIRKTALAYPRSVASKQLEKMNTTEPTITRHFSSEALHFLASLYDEYETDASAYRDITGENPEDEFDLETDEGVEEMRDKLYFAYDAVRLENGNLLVPKNQ